MKQRKVERPKVKREWQMHAQMSRSVGLVQACHSNFTPFLPGPICEHISESPIWNPSSLKRLEKVLCRDVRGLFFFFFKEKNICNYRLYSSRFSSLESFFFSAIVLRCHRANTASDDIIVHNPSQWVFSVNPFRTKLKISYRDQRSAWLG